MLENQKSFWKSTPPVSDQFSAMFFPYKVLQEINWKYSSILLFFTIMAENFIKVPQWTCCYLTVPVLMEYCTPVFLQLETYLNFVSKFIFHYVLTKIFREKFFHLCEDFTESLFKNVIILCKYFLRNTNLCLELGNPHCSRTCLAYISYNSIWSLFFNSLQNLYCYRNSLYCNKHIPAMLI